MSFNSHNMDKTDKESYGQSTLGQSPAGDPPLEKGNSDRLNGTDPEQERLKEKQENDARAYDIVLKNMLSVMETKTKADPASPSGDTLFQACALVGNTMGITFKSLPGNLPVGKEKLDTLLRLSGVRNREVALKGEWWTQDNGPMLAFTKADKAPVALIPHSPRRYDRVDPDSGKRVKVNRAVAETLDPFAHLFYRPFPAKQLNGMDLLRFSMLKNRSDVVTLLLMGVLGSLLGLVPPMATGMIFDTMIPEAARSQMVQLGLVLVTCAMATAVFEITKGAAVLRLEGKVDAALQCAVMDRLLLLSPTFFRRFTAGDLAERTLGINAIRQVMSSVVITSLLSSIFSIFYFLLLFWYSWQLALVALGLTCISVFITLLLAFLQIRYQRELAAVQGKISGMLLQLITGISKLRITGTEDRAFIQWAEAFTVQQRLTYKSGTISNVMATFNTGFPVLASMTLFFAFIYSDTLSFSTGTFLAFTAAYANFQNALLQVSTTLMTIMNIVPLYERARPILEAIPETDTEKLHPGILKGDLEVSHINFRYAKEASLVLKDLSMMIKAGELVAIVGSSGSGKSTLFRLLLGFESQESGSIYYDDQDIHTLDVREVRRQIGVVLQNSQIMAGDIFKNIIGSASWLTVDDAWKAADMVGLTQDIKAMPMGMHTMLQAGGGSLSGGQKQRLMIAQAIVHRPRIIYFDEATSALDNQTQATVIKSLESLQATRVVIAHRLSTIINADRIFVLEQGRIVQSGTYGELMQQPGVFADLAKRQMA